MEKHNHEEDELKEKKEPSGELQDEPSSGEEILNQIEKDAQTSQRESLQEEAGELLKKLGLSKKDKLKKENAELRQKTDELNDKLLRLHAEFDNYKKRNAKERIEFSKIASLDVIMSLLPVLDDFNRAAKQMDSAPDSAALNDGVKLIRQKFLAVLESKGLRAMKSIGEPFDPELHDAVTEIPVEDKDMKGKVVDEIECGYYLFDKLIRHAKVVVGK